MLWYYIIPGWNNTGRNLFCKIDRITCKTISNARRRWTLLQKKIKINFGYNETILIFASTKLTTMSYTRKLNELHGEVVNELRRKISVSMTRSKHLNNSRCLRIPELFEKLKTPQGCTIEEVLTHGIIDTSGMSWNYNILDTHQLCGLVDTIDAFKKH
jgi:hypothetical protein